MSTTHTLEPVRPFLRRHTSPPQQAHSLQFYSRTDRQNQMINRTHRSRATTARHAAPRSCSACISQAGGGDILVQTRGGCCYPTGVELRISSDPFIFFRSYSFLFCFSAQKKRKNTISFNNKINMASCFSTTVPFNAGAVHLLVTFDDSLGNATPPLRSFSYTQTRYISSIFISLIVSIPVV